MRMIDADHLRRWILSRVFQTQLSVADVIDQIDREDTIKPQLSSAQPEKRTDKRTETHACDSISRHAVKHLDLFTKTYCIDKSVKDDLVFRCNQCDFQLPDGTCLVKTMAKKLYPDYREFGSMGDL